MEAKKGSEKTSIQETRFAIIEKSLNYMVKSGNIHGLKLANTFFDLKENPAHKISSTSQSVAKLAGGYFSHSTSSVDSEETDMAGLEALLEKNSGTSSYMSSYKALREEIIKATSEEYYNDRIVNGYQNNIYSITLSALSNKDTRFTYMKETLQKDNIKLSPRGEAALENLLKGEKDLHDRDFILRKASLS